MKKKISKKLMTVALVTSIVSTNSIMAVAAVPQDGKTDATQTVEAYGDGYSNWEKEWDEIKNDWTQISLTPGSDATKLNFAWYSLATESVPKLKIGKGKKMVGAKEYTAIQTDATTNDKDEDNVVEYKSNKVTATGLEENTTYYYTYQVDGKWQTPTKYQTQSTDKFSFIFVGDPQIGSSNPLKGKDTQEFYDAQSKAVANDTFNWNTTLNQAVAKTNNKASFVLSAGDQIQTTKKKAPNSANWGSEIEYTGYLSPDALKSLSVATAVGNHDADNANYKYHFNTPNNSELGSNGIVGGDYWFTYGDALFMVLNTQDTTVTEHKEFIEKAVAANKDSKWRIATLHQDIYGSGKHSNEPEITNLRYSLVPYFEANDVDVVFSGHDHTYSRSKILKGGKKTIEYTDDEFDVQLEKDIDSGDDTSSVFVANGNIKDDTTDIAEQAYLRYLKAIMDSSAVKAAKTANNTVNNPDGILYVTASSASGSKYYDLVSRKQDYIANRWQGDVPTYSVVDMSDETFTINTYRTDTDEKIDETFSISKEKNNDSESVKEVEKVDLQKANVSGVKSVTYNGKTKKQSIIVKSSTGKTLVENKDYVVKYSKNKDVGLATMELDGIGNCQGVKKINFIIKPAKIKISSAVSKKAKKATVKVSSTKASISGYQITYSLKKSFKGAKSKISKKASVQLTGLKKNKTYYVKARAYKKIGSKKVYGTYGSTRKVKIKG